MHILCCITNALHVECMCNLRRIIRMLILKEEAKQSIVIRLNPAVMEWLRERKTFSNSISSMLQDAMIKEINAQEVKSANTTTTTSKELINNAPKAQTKARKSSVKSTAKKKIKVLAGRPSSIPVQIWEEYIALRKTKKAILTKTAFATIIEQGRIAGLDELDTVKTCLSNGWAGFKASWVNKDKGIISYGTDQRDCKQDQGIRRSGETESQYRDRLSRQISEEFAEIVRADPSERSTPEQF